jgi:hypothetical protein
MSPTSLPPPKGPPEPKRDDEDVPEFAEEAAPKVTEFGTAKAAKDITQGRFDRMV